MTGARSSSGGRQAVRHLTRLGVDAHRLDADARPELPAALRLQRRRDPRVRHRDASSAAIVTCPSGPPSSSTRTVRSAAHGGTNGRAAGLRRAASRRAGFVALAAALYLCAGVAATWPAVRTRARTSCRAAPPANGEAAPGRPSAVALPLLARRPPARARPRARGATRTPSGPRRSRSRTTPAGRSAFSSGRSARCSGSSSAGTCCSSSSTCSPACSRAPGCVSSGCRAGLRSPAGSCSRSRRTACSRASATCSARSRSCCRCRCGRSSGRGAAARWWLVLSGSGRRVDSAVGTGASRARRDPVRARLRDLPHARPAPARGRVGRRRRRRRRGPARARDADQGLDGVGRPQARRDHALLGKRRRLPLAQSRPRAQRAVRLPRLADAAARTRGAGPARALATLCARGTVGGRCCRSRSCSRSARTRRSTRRCGTRCRRSGSRACPSDCCRSRACASPRWWRSRSHVRVTPSLWWSRSRSLLVDLHAQVYRESAPGEPERVAYRGDGRLFELPVFDPSVHYGSVYLWYDTASQRERPSRLLDDGAARGQARRPTACSASTAATGATAPHASSIGSACARLHCTSVCTTAREPHRWFAWQSLLAHGWRVQRVAGPVWLFERRPSGLQTTLPAPNPTVPVFCQGWYADTRQRPLHERDARAVVGVRRRTRATDVCAAPPPSTRHRARRHRLRLAPRHGRRSPPDARPGPEEARRRSAAGRATGPRIALAARRDHRAQLWGAACMWPTAVIAPRAEPGRRTPSLAARSPSGAR